jgi:hypothetical protein
MVVGLFIAHGVIKNRAIKVYYLNMELTYPSDDAACLRRLSQNTTD